MPSQAAVNAVGALGGAVLALCLAPQLIRLYRTRSSKDLSYLYLLAYSTGLLLTFVYLYLEGATVTWICTIIEMVCALAVMGAKGYLERGGGLRSGTGSPDAPELGSAEAAGGEEVAMVMPASAGAGAAVDGLDLAVGAAGTGLQGPRTSSSQVKALPVAHRRRGPAAPAGEEAA